MKATMSRLRRAVRMAAMPDDHAAFRAGIDANPADQAPWGVYADYLDEQGMGRHARAARYVAGLLGRGDYAHFQTGGRSRLMLHDFGDFPERPSDFVDSVAASLPQHHGHVRLDIDGLGQPNLTHSSGESRWFDSDWDHPGLATSFGWQACPHGDTDGTVDCPHRSRGDMMAEAYDFLRAHEGEEIPDPGYFEPERMARAGRPTRLSRADLPGLIAGAHEAPDDQAPKLILADALHEVGHTGAADVIRRATGHAPTKRDMARPFFPRTTWGYVNLHRPDSPVWLQLYPATSERLPDGFDARVQPAPAGRYGFARYRGLGIRLMLPSDNGRARQAAGGGWHRTVAVHHTHDPDLIRRLLAENGPPTWGNIHQYRWMLRWLRPVIGEPGGLDVAPYGRPPEPEKLSMAGRLRRAVRLGRADNAALAAALKDDPHDAGAWGVLADSLRESGAEHWANLAGQIGQHGRPPLWLTSESGRGYRVFHHPDLAAAHSGLTRGEYTAQPVVQGTLHGMGARVSLIDFVDDWGDYPEESPPSSPMAAVELYHQPPGADSGTYPLPFGHAVIPAHEAQGLMHELAQQNQGQYLQGHNLPGVGRWISPEQRSHAGVRSVLARPAGGGPSARDRLRRAVRMAMPVWHREMADALEANPLDGGAWQVMADHFHENGKPWTAQALRLLGRHGGEYYATSRQQRPPIEHMLRGPIQWADPIGANHTLMDTNWAGDHFHLGPFHAGLYVGGEGGWLHLWHVRPDGQQNRDIGIVSLPPEIAHGVLHELEPASAGHEWVAARLADLRRQYPAPPARLTRTGMPVRLAREDDPGLLRAIAANPWDDAPHLILADSLQEQGSPLGELIRRYASHQRDNNYWDWREPGASRIDEGDDYHPEDNQLGVHAIGSHGPFNLFAQPSGFGGDPDAPLNLMLYPAHDGWRKYQFRYNLELSPHEVRALAQQLGNLGPHLEEAARHQWHGGPERPNRDDGFGFYDWPAYDEIVSQPPPERLARGGHPVRLAATSELLAHAVRGSPHAREALSLDLHAGHRLPALADLLTRPPQPAPAADDQRTLGASVVRGGPRVPLTVGFHYHGQGRYRLALSGPTGFLGHYWVDKGTARRAWEEFAPHVRDIPHRQMGSDAMRWAGEADHQRLLQHLGTGEVGDHPPVQAVIQHLGGPPRPPGAPGANQDDIKTSPQVIVPQRPSGSSWDRLSMANRLRSVIRMAKPALDETVYDPWIRGVVQRNLESKFGNVPVAAKPGVKRLLTEPITQALVRRAGDPDRAMEAIHSMADPAHVVWSRYDPARHLDFYQWFLGHAGSLSLYSPHRGEIAASASNAPGGEGEAGLLDAGVGTPTAGMRAEPLVGKAARVQRLRESPSLHPDAVLRAVARRPGASQGDVGRYTGLTADLVHAAVGGLVAGGKVAQHRIPNPGGFTTRLWPAGHPDIPTGTAKTRMDEIVDHLKAGKTGREISRLLGILPQQVANTIKRAKLRGLLPIGFKPLDGRTVGRKSSTFDLDRVADLAKSGLSGVKISRQIGASRRLTSKLIEAARRQGKLARAGAPVRLGALKDRPVGVAGAAQRAGSSNHADLVTVLRDVLDKSGLSPNKIYPAVHDFGGQARASVVAAVFGERHPQAADYGAAWQGLIAKQPAMVVFRSQPQGADSVYRFGFKGPQSAMSKLLDGIGVANRVYVEGGGGTHVFLYDRGRRLRDAVGQLAGRIGLEVTEHVGNGHPVGGGDDVGRAAYRDEIRGAERQGRQGKAIKMSRRATADELAMWMAALHAHGPHFDLPNPEYMDALGAFADHMEEIGDPRAFIVRGHYGRHRQELDSGATWPGCVGSLHWQQRYLPGSGYLAEGPRSMTSADCSARRPYGVPLRDGGFIIWTAYSQRGRGRYANRPGPVMVSWAHSVGHDEPYGPNAVYLSTMTTPSQLRDMARQLGVEQPLLQQHDQPYYRTFDQLYPSPAEPDRLARPAAPVRLALDPALVAGLASAPPRDTAPWLVFADHLKDEGFHGLAAAINRGRFVGMGPDGLLDDYEGQMLDRHSDITRPREIWSAWMSPSHPVGQPYFTASLDYNHHHKTGRLWVSASHSPVGGGHQNLNHFILLQDPDVVHAVARDIQAHNLSPQVGPYYAGHAAAAGRIAADLEAAGHSGDRLRMGREGRAVRMALDPDLVRGMADARPGDYAPWGVFADHLEGEGGMPALAHAVRHGEPMADGEFHRPPIEPHERPDAMEAGGFPVWQTGTGAKVYVSMDYYPSHGAARVIVKPYTQTGIGEAPERIVWLRDPAHIHAVAAEQERLVRADGEPDWANEFADIREHLEQSGAVRMERDGEPASQPTAVASSWIASLKDDGPAGVGAKLDKAGAKRYDATP